MCARGHSYDIARSGYINLLQPQDRRSLDAGDSKAAVEARARLIGAGVGRRILDAFAQRAAALPLRPDTTMLELGSGAGDLLAAVEQQCKITGIGIDLSTAATEHAAKRFPGITWVVANADRRLPVLDKSVGLVLSHNARRNPAECARVLTSGGYLLISVPAPDDLIELREFVQGQPLERERAAAVVDAHAPAFRLLERQSIREPHSLDRAALSDLLQGTYRGMRNSQAERLDALTKLEVTLSSELLVFTL